MKLLLFLLILSSSNCLWATICYPYQSGEACIPAISSREPIAFQQTATPSWPMAIWKLFNQSANYSGPNCYNAVLVATEVFPIKAIRYVAPSEFESWLLHYFDQVDSPLLGDIVVYEAQGPRGHAAFYLGDDLVFHKKSYPKGFLYRITKMEDVGLVELNEWMPGRFDTIIGGLDEGIGKTPKAFYRRKKIAESYKYNKTETLWQRLLELVETELVHTGPNWSVGKQMGLLVENTLVRLHQLAKEQKLHPHLVAKLESLKDQVFQSLEENYYAEVRSQRRIDEINAEICYPKSSFNQKFILELIRVLKVDAEEVMPKLTDRLSQMDLVKCRNNLVDFIIKR
jgi:hypothetical protein